MKESMTKLIAQLAYHQRRVKDIKAKIERTKYAVLNSYPSRFRHRVEVERLGDHVEFARKVRATGISRRATR